MLINSLFEIGKILRIHRLTILNIVPGTGQILTPLIINMGPQKLLQLLLCLHHLSILIPLILCLTLRLRYGDHGGLFAGPFFFQRRIAHVKILQQVFGLAG